MDQLNSIAKGIQRGLDSGPEDGPFYERLARVIEAMVGAGDFAAGMRLPASRDLAAALGRHRTTIVEAYHLLARRGVVEAGVGRGTFIKEPRPGTAVGGVFPWTEIYGHEEGGLEIEDILSHESPAPGGETPISLSGAIPDPDLFPMADFQKVLVRVVKREGSEVLRYAPTEGIRSLREQVALRLSARGTPVDPDRVLIVQGSQQGLDLVARTLLRPGDLVAVESPTYAHALALLRSLGVRLVPVPLDDKGIRVDMLERVAARESIRLLYTMPTFQNPTGLTQPLDRRKELLEAAGRWGIPVLEDHFDAELRFAGESLPTLKSLDRRDQVILLGTFSKILFPGLRVGWLVVPGALQGPLVRLIRSSALSTSRLSQEILAEFCRQRLLDRHLEAVCGVYASRREALLRAMEEFFPESTRWTHPRDGGMTLWVTLPEGLNAVSIAVEARRAGVLVAPGPLFFVEGGQRHLSLSSTAESQERIREGVRRLGEILHGALDRAERRPGRGAEVGPLV